MRLRRNCIRFFTTAGAFSITCRIRPEWVPRAFSIPVGAKFIDFDSDGWKDLFVGHSHVINKIQLTKPHLRYREAPLLLKNVRGKFVDITVEAGSALQQRRATRGVAFGYLNNDGWVNMVLNCNNEPAVILENQRVSGNHWLMVNTVGSTSNRDGIGTQVRLVTEFGQEQYAMVATGSSHLSSKDRRMHFGPGANRTVKLLELIWPSGKVQRLEKLPVDRVMTIREP